MNESTARDESNGEIANKRLSDATERSGVHKGSKITPQALYRISATALVLTGVSLAIGQSLHPEPPFAETVDTTRWAAAHVLWWFGGLAAVLGFSGLYLRQRESVGLLGFVGGGFAIVGSALIACAMFFEAFIAPTIATRAPELFTAYPAGGGWEGFLAGVLAAGGLLGIGLVLFGIAMHRAGIMPRWAIVLTVLGGVPFAVNFLLPRAVAIVAAIAFGLGLAGLGSALWKAPYSSLTA